MAVDRVIWVEGAKAEAEATRAAMTASLYILIKVLIKSFREQI
jgi:hypothetical protein